MSKLATVLREEIARLGRKEAKRDGLPLKRRVVALERTVRQQRALLAEIGRQFATAARRRTEAVAPAPATAEPDGTRLGPRSIRSQRKRLKLSQAEFARLTGVTTNAVYLWESGNAKPRGKSRAAILATRAMGVREARERLERVGVSGAAGRKKGKRALGGPGRRERMGRPQAGRKSRRVGKRN